MSEKYIPTFCPPSRDRNAEIDNQKSVARQQMEELDRQARIQGKVVFAGRLISRDELNTALDANS